MRRLLGLLLLGLALAVFVGCGDDDDGYNAPANTQTSGSVTIPPTTPSGETVVTMKDIQFVPADVKVAVGQKIVWTNDDEIAHTVTATKGATFDSGIVQGGDTYSYTAKKAGTIDYVCTIHPNQKGTITVTK